MVYLNTLKEDDIILILILRFQAKRIVLKRSIFEIIHTKKKKGNNVDSFRENIKSL